MPEPFVTLIGGALLNVGCGLITNVMDPARKAAWYRVLGWWEKGKTPENHDLLKATHNAYVAAMHVMAEVARETARDDGDVAAASALRDLCGEPSFFRFRWDGEHLPLAETEARIDALLDQKSLSGEEARWRRYNALILDDLSVWGIPRSARFDALFLDGLDGHAPWHLQFREQFAEVLKADERYPEGERVFRILAIKGLAELKAMGAQVIDTVGRIEATTTETNDLMHLLVEKYLPAAEELKVTNEALIALARPIAEKVDDPQQALQALGGAIDEFIRQRDEAEQGTNLGELVDRTLRNIAAANKRGAFDEGAREGERGFAEWRDQQEAVRQAGLRLIETNVEQHRLRFDSEAMAYWIGQRLALENGGTIDFEELRAERARWYVLGRERGLRLELDISIALARRSVSIAKSDVERASAQNSLAIALRAQGERVAGQAGLAMLTEAVAAYREALSVRTEAASPVDWAATQNNLGNALQTLAQRTEGDAGLALQGEAVAAFRAALSIRTEETMPFEWATTQSNLGNALAIQGQRTAGDAGLVLLAESVETYHMALSVRLEETVPVQWAMTQNNLGNVLQAQGSRKGGTAGLALLAEAAAAYRAALRVRTESATPVDWATTQNNLGNVLRAQGERTAGEAGLTLLEGAVAAFRAALPVRTEAAMPVQWGLTQCNLGNALQTLGERTGGEAGTALLWEAIDAYRAALTVRTESAMPVQWALTQNNLGAAYRTLGDWTGGEAGLALLADAVTVYRAALRVRTEQAMPVQWAMTQNNLGGVLTTQGRRTEGEPGLALLTEAIGAYRAAMRVLTPHHFGHYHEVSRRNLALAEALLAARSK